MTGAVDDLIAFLHARLDEDERDAFLALRGYPGGRPELMQSWQRSARWLARDGWVEVEYAERLPAMFQSMRSDLVRIARRDDECTAEHIARHDPARVLADVAAKRAIIALHERVWLEPGHPLFADAHLTKERLAVCASCEPPRQHRRLLSWPCPTLKVLGLSYVDHSDYQESWKP